MKGYLVSVVVLRFSWLMWLCSILADAKPHSPKRQGRSHHVSATFSDDENERHFNEYSSFDTAPEDSKMEDGEDDELDDEYRSIWSSDDPILSSLSYEEDETNSWFVSDHEKEEEERIVAALFSHTDGSDDEEDTLTPRYKPRHVSVPGSGRSMRRLKPPTQGVRPKFSPSSSSSSSREFRKHVNHERQTSLDRRPTQTKSPDVIPSALDRNTKGDGQKDKLSNLDQRTKRTDMESRKQKLEHDSSRLEARHLRHGTRQRVKVSIDWIPIPKEYRFQRYSIHTSSRDTPGSSRSSATTKTTEEEIVPSSQSPRVKPSHPLSESFSKSGSSKGSQAPTLPEKHLHAKTFPDVSEQHSRHDLSKRSATAMSLSSNSRTTTPVAGPWVRKLLACRAAKEERLMLVPLDFWTDPFNLSHLAPIVERLVYRMSGTLPPPSAALRNRPSVASESARYKTEQSNVVSGNRFLGQPNPPPQQPSFPLYRKALQLITSQQEDYLNGHDGADGNLPNHGSLDSTHVEMAAVVLYCFVHQRYVVSPRGLEALRRRFLLHANNNENNNHVSANGKGSHPLHENDEVPNSVESTMNPLFGRCPNPTCHGMPLLPAGLDDYHLEENGSVLQSPRQSLRYCGLCHKYWVHHWNSDCTDATSRTNSSVDKTLWSLDQCIQDCAWGLTLGPLFHITFPGFLRSFSLSSIPVRRPDPPQEPRIFGFRLHPDALTRHN